VYKGEHLASHETIAWCEYDCSRYEHHYSIEAAKNMLLIESPFVVPILDSFEKDDTFYIIEEFYEDGTLETKVNELIESKQSLSEAVFFSSLFYYYYCCLLLYCTTFCFQGNC
jgi:hypothetical protein